MGICSSCDSTQLATAKLILQDGRMMEFTYPVKVGYVLQKNPMCFICNSDDMDFDDVVSAISADEELQLGHLYFALPLSWLRRSLQPLRAEEMAALAVKANSALTSRGGCGREKCRCRRRCATPVVFPADKLRRIVSGGDDTVGSSVGTRKVRGGGSGRSGSSSERRKFAAKLNTIDE
ncbi:PREDICTED: uncharacterized protein LOC104807563 isoform X3 [Tarenaya hassleriana]|uniref:uncharacterized protein LOC104807563 isoform X3 n=1 Tax=Tarenaya hassleriana TaxID=28532 RepID=UPI0008FD85F8|nr:PREDICTED: uncharacterized protein LOC104807563 isoform X3 [Tarenaya hassleriana]